MIRVFLYLLLFVSFASYSQSGKITGKIVDSKTGETLPGATILIEGTTKAASADFDGNFSLNNVPVGTLNVIISYISYDTKKITGVDVKANDVTNINIQLDPSSAQKDLNEVVIVVELNKENTSALILQQKNNISVSDGVSAETIKRTPDRSTSDVLKRVSGAAIQDNKFAIIRGLNERYNAAYLNGAPLPSSESDRKAFSFDVFPSNMLDNLIIIKTARPDLPGEFAGGIIEINTKNIPDKNFVSVSTTYGHNAITTGKEQYYYKGGKKDWLGYDDGTRKMAVEIPYFEEYPLNVHAQGALAKNVPISDWSLYTKKFAPNLSMQISSGYNFKRKERDFFGLLFSFTYNKTNSYNTTIRKAYTNNLDITTPSDLDSDYEDKIYSEQVLTGTMLNMSVKLNENHSISCKNLYSINSDDRVIRRTGSATPTDLNPILINSYALWFTGNKILTSQLNGDHYFPKSKIKFTWLGAVSTIKRDVPNLRRHAYSKLEQISDPIYPEPKDTIYKALIGETSISDGYGGTMLWSSLKERINSFKFDVSRGFKFSEKFKMEIKTGGLFQERDRVFDIRQLGYTQYNVGAVTFKDSLLYLNPSDIITQQNMGVMYTDVFGGKAGGFKLLDATKPQDPYRATSTLQAAFLMFDFKYSSWFRGVAGARLENYRQTLAYHSQAYFINKTDLYKDTTVLDILPSANLIFSVTEKQNIRVSYSRTLNRPEFRELAPFAFFDFNTRFVFSGNDTLQRATIDNYDLRYEFYPGRSQLLSVSGFYKNFTNPIEQVASLNKNEVSYKNVQHARCSGFELEYRVIIGTLHKKDSTKFGKFLDRLTLFTNYAYIKSEADLTSIDGTPIGTRYMQGQSPYVVNGGLTYLDNDNDYSVSASVNRVGKRIYIVGSQLYPSIWENGRTVLDLQATKSFFKKKLELRFNVKDLLAQKLYFYQDKNENLKFDKESGDDIIWITNYGPTYSFQITFKF